jgi:hypothetical protein
MRKCNRRALLFLCQRLPFRPNKGEKISSFNIVRYLGQRFDLHVGTFVDAPEDMVEIDRFRPFCASLHVERITKPWAWLRAVPGWLGGLPVSFALFRSLALGAYVRDVIAKYQPVAIFAHSSNSSEYALAPTDKPTLRIFDFVDADSEKFLAYAAGAKGCKRWLFTLEAYRVRADEARLAACADVVGSVSDEEAALFRSVVDVPAAKIVTIAKGLDTDTFNPTGPLVTAGMGRWSSLCIYRSDALPTEYRFSYWFANIVLPAIRKVMPGAIRHRGVEPDSVCQDVGKTTWSAGHGSGG